jgi:hypothetical protein
MNLAETDLHVKVKRRPIVATFRVKREGYKTKKERHQAADSPSGSVRRVEGSFC